ncbi:MAG: hypothetical protein ABUL77_03305 [Bacteroidota bacterium]
MRPFVAGRFPRAIDLAAALVWFGLVSHPRAKSLSAAAAAAVVVVGTVGLALAACGGSPAAIPFDAGSTGCPVPAPTTCPDPMPRYAEVMPILEQRCVSCHAGLPNGPWPLTTYTHVADWEQELRAALLDCSMPPADAGVGLTSQERVTVLTWIRCGLPE